MQQIAIFNQSDLPDQEVEQVIPSIQTALDQHFSPAWNIQAKLTYVPKNQQPNPSMWSVGLFLCSDQAGALGYHDLTAGGMPMGKAFVQTDLIYGSSWTVTLTHELFEMLVDPLCQEMVQMGSTFYTKEVSDPVESDNMGILINNVLISDFVFPSWYQLGSLPPYDANNQVHAPFQIGSGGYQMIWQNGSWQQLGERAPKYRVKNGSRREKRMIGSEHFYLSEHKDGSK